MIRKVVSKYALALHLAFLAAVPVAFAPFAAAFSAAKVILWVSALVMVWLIAEPSVRLGEHGHTARRRVFSGIVRDPLFWFFFLVSVFAGIRYVNTGAAMFYDAEKSVWKILEPSAPMMPSSVGEAGFMPFAASVGLLVLVCAVRHGLGLAARQAFGLWGAFFSSIGAVVACCFVCSGDSAFVAKASIGLGGEFTGVFFGVWLLVAIAAAAFSEARGWGLARFVFFFAVTGNAVGLVYLTPPVLALPFAVFAVIVFVFSMVWLGHVSSSSTVTRYAVFMLISFAIPGLLIASITPAAVQSAKLAGLDMETAYPETAVATATTLNHLSLTLWRESPWLGVGVGGFPLHLPFVAQSADWAMIPQKPLAASNLFVTLLAERGILGCLLLLAGVIMLVGLWGYRLFGAITRKRGDDEDGFVFASPPVTWVAIPALLCMVAAAFFTSASDISPAAFAVTSSMALAAASFPKKKESN